MLKPEPEPRNQTCQGTRSLAGIRRRLILPSVIPEACIAESGNVTVKIILLETISFGSAESAPSWSMGLSRIHRTKTEKSLLAENGAADTEFSEVNRMVFLTTRYCLNRDRFC